MSHTYLSCNTVIKINTFSELSDTSLNSRPQKYTLNNSIRWSTLLNKMYESTMEQEKISDQLSNNEPSVCKTVALTSGPFEREQDLFRDGAMSLLGSVTTTDQPLRDQSNNIFVTTSHTCSTTTTLTPSKNYRMS